MRLTTTGVDAAITPDTVIPRRGCGCLLLILLAIPLASFAGSQDFEKLGKAVEAVARASRSSAGNGDSRILEGIDRDQLDLLEKNFGAAAAKAVGDLRVRAVLPPERDVPSGEDVLADILRADPELIQLGSMGLAKALRQTQQYYVGRGDPLPDAVKVMLAVTFPKEVLEAMRTVRTDAETTLPAILNEVQTEFGEAVGGQSAVTVENVIAFSEIPDSSSVDFWAHEIRHSMQYRELGGIDAFAAAYTKDYRQLEGDANAVGRKAVTDAQNVLAVIHALNPAP
jgi:hypothetical protein